MFTPAVIGPEGALAGQPAMLIALVSVQIALTLGLVYVLANRSPETLASLASARQQPANQSLEETPMTHVAPDQLPDQEVRAPIGEDTIRIDHVVLWVRDAHEALRFFVQAVGLSPVRQDAFQRGSALFPSVRLNGGTILDLMDDSILHTVRDLTGAEAGARLNHLCLSLTATRYAAVVKRLASRGVALTPARAGSFGARGSATASTYLRDPSGNVIELRHYDSDSDPIVT
jgi:catechol 2,3-dioxygenase-like lactoylglutathione lyase family enzyme